MTVSKAQLTFLEKKGIEIVNKEPAQQFNRFKIQFKADIKHKVDKVLKEFKDKSRGV